MFGESHFYDVYFSIVTSAERGWLTENQIWASVWHSGFQHPHIQIFGGSEFSNESVLLELLLKCDGLQKIIFWAPVWDSGFQRTHIQIFRESQFYNAFFY